MKLTLAILLLLVSTAQAARLDLRVDGVLHGTPIVGQLMIDSTAQTWEAELWTETSTIAQQWLKVRGTYSRESTGDLTLHTPYTNAIIILRSQAGGRYNLVSSTVDLSISTIKPR